MATNKNAVLVILSRLCQPQIGKEQPRFSTQVAFDELWVRIEGICQKCKICVGTVTTGLCPPQIRCKSLHSTLRNRPLKWERLDDERLARRLAVKNCNASQLPHFLIFSVLCLHFCVTRILLPVCAMKNGGCLPVYCDAERSTTLESVYVLPASSVRLCG